MTTAEINLTDLQVDALHALALKTGKTENQLLHEAVEKLIGEVGKNESGRLKRLKYLRQGKGIWKDRDDLPDFENLRREWDRFDAGPN